MRSLIVRGLTTQCRAQCQSDNIDLWVMDRLSCGNFVLIP